MITYSMICRAVEKTTQMRRHVRLVAQGVRPSPYTEFDANLAKEITVTSGGYSKNPIKKISSWIKEFVFNIKSDISYMKNNPPNLPDNKIINETGINKNTGTNEIHFS